MRSAIIFTVLFASACISINNDRERFGDPEIAMVMRIANLGEVREGALAREKGAEPSVRDFATMMVNEHTLANSRAESELMRVDIVSVDTMLSRQLDADSGAAADRLRLLSGHSFDRAYMDRQIQVHQDVLNLIDKRLAPLAKKKVVKEQLTAMRATVEQHLSRAKQIAAALPQS